MPMSTPFCFPVRVYWEDTDAGGIVFYANYLKFFERARTEWLRSLGLHQHTLRAQTGGVFVVSETTVKYHRPAQLDDLLTITAQVQHLGKASVVFAQQAWRGEVGGTLLAAGTIRVGWVNAQTLQPSRMPAAVLHAMTPSSAAPFPASTGLADAFAPNS